MAFNGPPSDHALGPRGPRRRSLSSMHFEMWLRLFVEHLVSNPEIKGLETPFKQAQPPTKKNAQNQHQTMGHNPRMGLCPKTTKKLEKMGSFL
jgi:hypothetical protein